MPAARSGSSLCDLRSALADRGLQLESVSVRVAGEGASNAGGGRDRPVTGRSARPRAAHVRPASIGRHHGGRPTRQTGPHEGQAVWMLA